MAELIVVGGGLAGLGAALFAARRGHRVTLIERDAEAPQANPDQCFRDWNRRGVGQMRQIHGFMALACKVLAEEAPDVLAPLRERAVNVPMLEPTDPDLPMMLLIRRTSFEQALRLAVQRQPGIAMCLGSAVAGLLAETNGGVPHVTGVRLESGQTMHGDLVIDASGRGTHARPWLAAIGARPVPEQHQEVGFSYLTRWYRLKPGATFPRSDRPPGVQAPYGLFMVVPADGDWFSVTAGLGQRDPWRKHMFDAAIFDRVTAAVGICAPWIAAGIGETDPQPYANVHNGRRRLVDSRGPIVTGLVLLGDSATHTNPTLGRGSSLALAHAQHLARTAQDAPADPAGYAADFDDWTQRKLGIWYDSQSAIDAAASVRMRAVFTGEAAPAPAYAARVIEALATAGAADPRIANLQQRLSGLLMTMDEVLAAPGVAQAIAPFMDNEGRQFPPCDLSRAGFEAVVQMH